MNEGRNKQKEKKPKKPREPRTLWQAKLRVCIPTKTRRFLFSALIVILYAFISFGVYTTIKVRWNNIEAYSEYTKKYETETSRRFKVVGKLNQKPEGKSSGHLWFLVKECNTGRKKEIDVAPRTFMSYEKGDYVWFKFTEAEMMGRREANKVMPDYYEGSMWVTFFVIGVLVLALVTGGTVEEEGEDWYGNSYKWKRFKDTLRKEYQTESDMKESYDNTILFLGFFTWILPVMIAIGVIIMNIIIYCHE